MNYRVKQIAILALAASCCSMTANAGGITVAEKGDSKLKLEGLLFLNTYQKTVTKADDTETKTLGLNLDRAYFTAKYYFDPTWMMRITTDVGQEDTLGKKSSVYIKYGYVEGNFSPAAQLRLGVSHTPWIDYEQGLWKHRYASKVFIDTNKFDASSDAGVGLKGGFSSDMIKYWITATNGNGYGDISPSKTMDLDARVSVYPIKGMTLDLQVRNGYKGTKTEIDSVSTKGIKNNLFQFMATYGEKNLYRLAAGYARNKSDNKDIAGTTKVTASGYRSIADETVTDKGYYLWAWGKFPGTEFGAFGRYESKKASSDLAATAEEKTSRYLLGLEYMPRSNVNFSLVVDQSKIENYRLASGNASDYKDNRIGVYSQIKF